MIEPSAKEQIFKADLSNIVRKVKSGKPLSQSERKTIEAEVSGEPENKTPEAATVPAPPEKIHAKNLIGELARHRVSLTTRRLGQLADKGLYPKPVREEYELRPTLLGLVEHYHGLFTKGDGAEKKERAKLATVKRQTGEEQLNILREKYVPKEDIGPMLRNVSLNQRAMLQRKLESELAPKLAGLTTLEIGAHMAAAVDEICAVFHDGVASWMDDPPAATPSTPSQVPPST